MLNLRHVEVFHAIMRAGTITEAARVLNVTQPAVSAALKQLERRLGMNLFDRVGGRLQPTPEARALLPDVAEIFGRIGALRRFRRQVGGDLHRAPPRSAREPPGDRLGHRAGSRHQP